MTTSARPSAEIWVCNLGLTPYRDAVALQKHIREHRLAGELPDTLLLLEHPPVYTRGRRSADGELTLGEDFYRARGIDVVDTDRGGRVTYHGPGQLVGYPIMSVHDIGAHLRTIEAAIIAALADYGVRARSRCAEGPDYTGVWVGERKIASIGVHVSRGVSTHGFAVNVDVDLDPFTWIVACGLPDVTMTSIACELPSLAQGHPAGTIDPHGISIDQDDFRARMSNHFCQAHRRPARLVSPHELSVDIPLQPHPPGPGTERLRGRMPRTSARRTATACADATQPSPTPDIATVVSDHRAPA